MSPYERLALVAGLLIGAAIASIWLNELCEKFIDKDDDEQDKQNRP